MRTIAVFPANASQRVRRLALAAGWDLEPFGEQPPTSEMAAVALARGPVLVLPPGARAPRVLRRVVVVHEGSPLVAPAMEAADEAALGSGAEIVVLHVASAARPAAAGSLPAPCFVDHSGYDWEEWRAEFLRRFCRCSEGLCVRLEVTTGEPAVAIPTALRRLRPDLVVVSWKGQTGPGRGRVVRALLRQASCPVLVLREPTEPEPEGSQVSGSELRAATGADR